MEQISVNQIQKRAKKAKHAKYLGTIPLKGVQIVEISGMREGKVYEARFFFKVLPVIATSSVCRMDFNSQFHSSSHDQLKYVHFFIHTYKSKNLPAEAHCQSDCKKARKWQVNYLATRRQLCKRSRLACHVKPLAACKPWHGMKKVEQKDGAGPSRLQNVKDALALKFHTFLRREQDRGICFQSPKHHTTQTQRHNTTTQHLHAPAER